MNDHTRPTAPGMPARDGARAPDVPDTAGEELLEELSPAEFEALRWSVRLGDGLDAAERAEFEAWRRADPAHQAAYDEMTGVSEAIDAMPAAGAARLQARVAIDRAGESATHAAVPVASATSPAPPRPTRRRALAAAAAVFAAAGGGWFGWEAWRSEPVFEQRYQTQRGQQLDVALPDGSQMRLDTATTAEVSLYRGRRVVRLAEGQAMFTVQSDKARPFDVRAGGTRVTVVGTRFSVRYTPSIGRSEVQVAVQEGRVRVAAASDAAAPAAIELAPGETVAADAQGRPGPVARIAPEGVAAWRSNRLSFDNLPLSAVLAELGRYGDVGIAVHDPAVAALPVTASVDLQRMGDFVRSLPQVLPVRLERRQGATEIVLTKR